MRKVTSKTVLIEKLEQKTIREMFVLFEKYYDHVTYERFVLDLKEKTHSFIFFEKGTSRLVGFSTIFRKPMPEITPGLFLFSGDTVMHEDFWGNKALQKSFFWFILSSKLKSPLKPVYWMLMSKGVKTYLMMRKNFKESYPNSLKKTPAHFQHALDSFYQSKFPEAFRPTEGLILFSDKMGSVKTSIRPPSEKALMDEEAEFFFKVNPRHLDGDELACICEIRFTDFLFHIFKYFIPVFATK
jgi:hypothetical protein